jgi:hypothetical protein
MRGTHYENNVRTATVRSKVKRWEFAFERARTLNMDIEKSYRVADTTLILEKFGIFPAMALTIALEIFYV